MKDYTENKLTAYNVLEETIKYDALATKLIQSTLGTAATGQGCAKSS